MSMAIRYLHLVSIAFSSLFLLAGAVWAETPWQINFSEPVTPVAKEILWFDDFLLWIISGISLFCFVLMMYIIFRFREGKNPTPSKTTHHTGLEVAWTLIPILILIVIAVPSFRVLDNQLIIPDGERSYNGRVLPEPSVNVTATGFSWYWNYAYELPGGQSLSFDSVLIEGEDLEAKRAANPGQEYPNLLTVDNELVIPVNETVRIVVTADPEGVIHSWFMPQFGIKIDAIPARINETWFFAEKEGVYFGACTELCGRDHSRMPITVRVVSRPAYNAWLKEAEALFAEHQNDRTPPLVMASKP